MRRLLTPAMGVVVALVAVFATGAFGGSSGGTISTFAGNGKSVNSGDGGRATSAAIVVRGVAVDTHGNVYIGADSRVRKVSPGGTITAFAGTGVPLKFSGDGGPATSATFGFTDWV